MPWIDAVAHHVDERVGQKLEHAVVDADAVGAGASKRTILPCRCARSRAIRGRREAERVDGDDAEPERHLVDHADEAVGLGLDRGVVVLVAHQPLDLGQEARRVEHAVVGELREDVLHVGVEDQRVGSAW